jgi:ABC-type phosphate transport system substrate-binding protein
MKSLTIRSCIGVLLAMVLTLPTAWADPILIINKNVSGEKVDAAMVKAIFLGKKVSWDGAGRVVLACLKSGPVAEEIYKIHAGMNSSSFNNHWRRLSMTGGGTAPKLFDKEDELRKFVAETPGALGFLDSASADASVVKLTPAP